MTQAINDKTASGLVINFSNIKLVWNNKHLLQSLVIKLKSKILLEIYLNMDKDFKIFHFIHVSVDRYIYC